MYVGRRTIPTPFAPRFTTPAGAPPATAPETVAAAASPVTGLPLVEPTLEGRGRGRGKGTDFPDGSEPVIELLRKLKPKLPLHPNRPRLFHLCPALRESSKRLGTAALKRKKSKP